MHTTPKINTFLFHSLHIQYVSSVSMILVHWYYWRSGKVKVLLNEKRKTTCDASCCCCLYVYTHVRTQQSTIYTIYSDTYRIYLFSESGEKSKKRKRSCQIYFFTQTTILAHWPYINIDTTLCWPWQASWPGEDYRSGEALFGWMRFSLVIRQCVVVFLYQLQTSSSSTTQQQQRISVLKRW